MSRSRRHPVLTPAGTRASIPCEPCACLDRGCRDASGRELLAEERASGGIPAYAYTLSSGNLPAGTTLNSSTGLRVRRADDQRRVQLHDRSYRPREPELAPAQATAARSCPSSPRQRSHPRHDPRLPLEQTMTLTATVPPTSSAKKSPSKSSTIFCTTMPLAGQGRDV